jgi:hypothetical protein
MASSLTRPDTEHAMREEIRLRRLALQIAAQLPEDLSEARTVLRYADELLEGFLVPTGSGGLNVVAKD